MHTPSRFEPDCAHLLEFGKHARDGLERQSKIVGDVVPSDASGLRCLETAKGRCRWVSATALVSISNPPEEWVCLNQYAQLRDPKFGTDT